MRSCPKCKSSDYNNRGFVLMINECGHSICKNCVETLFARNSGPCPVCGRTLKKNSFWIQTFDDPLVEKEVFFRKSLAKTFNLKEEDFPDLKAYNDYLEMIEDVVYKLVNDIDVSETKQQVDEFHRHYENKIVENRGKKSRDELWIQKNLDEEQRFKHRVKQIHQKDLETAELEKAEKADVKKTIEELKTSSEPAAFIVNNKQREQRDRAMKREREEAAQQGAKRRHLEAEEEEDVMVSGDGGGLNDGVPYTYQPPVIFLNGPPVPHISQLESFGYLRHIRAAAKSQLAGGYHESLGCYRALLDASSDLFYL